MIEKTSKVCFVGNCQARNLQKVANENGVCSCFTLFCSTEVDDNNGIDEAKSYLFSIFSRNVVSDIIKKGVVRLNPSRKDLLRFPTDVFVYTLFHESTSYYRHKNKKFILEVNFDGSMDKEFADILSNKILTDFDMHIIDQESYLDRFYEFIVKNSELFSSKRHIVIERIKNSAVPGEVKSSLNSWGYLEYHVDKMYNALEKNRHAEVLKTGLAQQKIFSGANIDSLFPVVIIKGLEGDCCKFSTYTDLEHPTTGYWCEVFKVLFSSRKCKNMDSENDHIVARNKLISCLRRRDINDYQEQILELSPYSVELSLDVIECAIFMFGKVVYEFTKIVLERTLKYVVRVDYQSRLQSLLSICSQDNPMRSLKKNAFVALWGAGGRCKAILNEIVKYFNVVCIFDCDKKKQGSNLLGIPIVSPTNWRGKESLKEAQYFEVIIVTTTFFTEVCFMISQYSDFKNVRILNSTIFEWYIAQEKCSFFS